MSKNLITITLFDLRKNIICSKTWINNAAFLVINMMIYPFTKKLSQNIDLSNFFPSIAISTILIGIVLISSHVFDEDNKDGSLDLYLTFNVNESILYLSKVIAGALELSIITAIAIPIAGLFYSIEYDLIFKTWLLVILAAPILTAISVFGSMLTVKLNKNSITNIVITFPLLISSLIILSLAIADTFDNSFASALPYIEINFGFGLVIIPLLCWLSKHLR